MLLTNPSLVCSHGTVLQLLLLVVCMRSVLLLIALVRPRDSSRPLYVRKWLFVLHVLLVTAAMGVSAVELALATQHRFASALVRILSCDGRSVSL